MSDNPIPIRPERTDSVEMQNGAIHLPTEFRDIARVANRAGLEGYEYVDLEIGLDLEKVMARPSDGLDMPTRVQIRYLEKVMARPSDGGWDMPTRVQIRYRKRQVTSIVECVKSGHRYWWINPLAIVAIALAVYLLVRWGLS